MATSRICSIPDCGKPERARRLCGTHYMRQRAHGDPRSDIPIVPKGHSIAAINDALNGAGPDDCWIWPLSRNRYGYGSLKMQSKTKLAHRVICERVHGAPPTSKHEAAHSCGQGHLGCVNPHHLSWKTHAENEADKILHGTSRNGNARLYEAEAIEMRALFATGKWSRQDLAKRFGLHYSSTCRVLSGEAWAKVTAES